MSKSLNGRVDVKQSKNVIIKSLIKEHSYLEVSLTEKEYLNIGLNSIGCSVYQSLNFEQAASLRNTISRWLNNNRKEIKNEELRVAKTQ